MKLQTFICSVLGALALLIGIHQTLAINSVAGFSIIVDRFPYEGIIIPLMGAATTIFYFLALREKQWIRAGLVTAGTTAAALALHMSLLGFIEDRVNFYDRSSYIFSLPGCVSLMMLGVMSAGAFTWAFRQKQLE